MLRKRPCQIWNRIFHVSTEFFFVQPTWNFDPSLLEKTLTKSSLFALVLPRRNKSKRNLCTLLSEHALQSSAKSTAAKSRVVDKQGRTWHFGHNQSSSFSGKTIAFQLSQKRYRDVACTSHFNETNLSTHVHLVASGLNKLSVRGEKIEIFRWQPVPPLSLMCVLRMYLPRASKCCGSRIKGWSPVALLVFLYTSQLEQFCQMLWFDKLFTTETEHLLWLTNYDTVIKIIVYSSTSVSYPLSKL